MPIPEQHISTARRAAKYLGQEVQELAPLIEGAMHNLGGTTDFSVCGQINQEIADVAVQVAKADGVVRYEERRALVDLLIQDVSIPLALMEPTEESYRTMGTRSYQRLRIALRRGPDLRRRGQQRGLV